MDALPDGRAGPVLRQGVFRGSGHDGRGCGALPCTASACEALTLRVCNTARGQHDLDERNYFGKYVNQQGIFLTLSTSSCYQQEELSVSPPRPVRPTVSSI